MAFEETVYVLVVRAWRHPGGQLCSRVGTITDPCADPGSWHLCVGRQNTLLVVSRWLDRCAVELPTPSPTEP